MCAAAYTPTKEDLVNVIKLLHDNGVDVTNSKEAYKTLKAYESNPQFCILLATVYGAVECPADNLNLPVPWIQYRHLAAITLKNNVSVARQALGEEAVTQVAQFAVRTLSDAPDERIARASAQIVVKITEITSLDWWAAVGLGDLADLLLNRLLIGGGLQTISALYTLQYLMEDMPKQVGQASEQIVRRVAEIAVSAQVPLNLRKASFRMCFNIYERSSLLDWNVDVLSPLQQGLVNASWTFAQTCTTLLEESCQNDVALCIAVLRSCVFLLAYADYFTEMNSNDQGRMTQQWVLKTMGIISQNTGDQRNGELAGAAIDLITEIVETHDASGGDGPVAFLAAPIESTIPALVPALVKFSIMADEEVEHIMESDDYQVREQTPVQFQVGGNNRDISQDEALGEDEAAMTLRRSALRCVDGLCRFSSVASFNALMQQIQPLWRSPEWRGREAGIVLLGTLASGCSAHIGSILSGVVEELLSFAENTNEHICVSSIAFWSLSRLAEDILSSAPQMFDKYLTTIIARMPSTSKRIQHTSVSAMMGALTVMRSFQCENRLMPHFAALLNTVAASLSMFSAVSLSSLVDLTTELLASLSTMGRSDMVTQLGEHLKQERSKRAQLFEQSYANTFVNEVPNSFVDTDVFSLDRSLVSVLSLIPDNTFAMTNLSVWSNVLQDVLNRSLTDDANMVLGIVSMCYGYFTCMTTAGQQEWNQSTSGALPQNTMQLLSQSTITHVKSAAVLLLEALVKSLGAAAVPDATYAPIMTFLAGQIRDEDDAELKQQYTQLSVTLILQNSNKAMTSETGAVLAAVSTSLRTDVYGDTLYSYTGIAFEICRLLAVAPSLVSSFNMDAVSCLLGMATNDFSKSEATIGWGSAMMAAPASMLGDLVGRSIVVALSWQMVAQQFPGTGEAVRSVLQRISHECADAFKAQLGNYPQGAQQMIFGLYFQ